MDGSAALIWDLIYVSKESGRTMSLVIKDGDETEMVGPFPAAEAGPKIVAALAEKCGMQEDEAEYAYIAGHFMRMSAGVNAAGQDYPFMV